MQGKHDGAPYHAAVGSSPRSERSIELPGCCSESVVNRILRARLGCPHTANLKYNVFLCLDLREEINTNHSVTWERVMERFVPRVFISYSWDSEEHKAWVKDLAVRLRNNGVDITLDDWQVKPATRLPHFMEKAVRENDFVLIVCTEGYRKKVEKRAGGVGYEGGIITGEILEIGNQEKFVPLLRSEEWLNSRPSWLAGANYLDFRGSPYQETAYARLLDTVFELLPQAPPLGSRVPGWGWTFSTAITNSGSCCEYAIVSKCRPRVPSLFKEWTKPSGVPLICRRWVFLRFRW